MPRLVSNTAPAVTAFFTLADNLSFGQSIWGHPGWDELAKPTRDWKDTQQRAAASRTTTETVAKSMPRKVRPERDAACAMAEACASACLEDEDRVSIMVRNLPNRVKLDHLIKHFGDLHLQDACGSIHLPVDPRTGVNKGYAFVSVSIANATRFIDEVEGTQIAGFLSQKRVSASWADKQRTGKRVTSKSSENWDRSNRVGAA